MDVSSGPRSLSIRIARTLRRAAVGVLLLAAIFGTARAARSAAPRDASSSFALQYATTLGTTGTPWPRSNATLNQPWGLGADRDGVWVANALGRNLVRFGTGPVEELGRAGDLLALWGQPVRRLAEVDVA